MPRVARGALRLELRAAGLGAPWLAWQAIRVMLVVLINDTGGEVSRLPEVDPGDDSICRWVLHHYRFDPERHQRRNVVVAAYADEAEFEVALASYVRRIQDEVASGTRDPAEHVSGVVWRAGRQAAQARGRTLRKAIMHGVDPRRFALDGPLPSNVAFFGWDSAGNAWSLGGSDPPPTETPSRPLLDDQPLERDGQNWPNPSRN